MTEPTKAPESAEERLVAASADLEALPNVEPEPEEAPVRESDPERVARAVESAVVEVRGASVRDETFGVEGDTVLAWPAGTSNATSLTHSSLELAPNLTENQKATRRHLN